MKWTRFQASWSDVPHNFILKFGFDTVDSYNTPSKEELIIATKLKMGCLLSFWYNSVQSEKKLTFQIYPLSINKPWNMNGQLPYTKMSEFVASKIVKTMVFTLSDFQWYFNWNVSLPSAILTKCTFQFGGIHNHKFFCIPTEIYHTYHRKSRIDFGISL